MMVNFFLLVSIGQTNCLLLVYYKIFCVTAVFKCEARLAHPIFLILLYSIFEPPPIISELKSEIDTGKN